MKIASKKLRRTLQRIAIAIGGTTFLIALILVVEYFFGNKPTCNTTEAWILCHIRESTLLNLVEDFSILVAVWLFFLEAPERSKQAHYEAWKTIDAANGLRTSYARFQALQDLNEDGISIKGLNAPEADLRGINLAGADLSHAYLSGADLSFANLAYANLSHANLVEAKLNNANLSHTHLTAADLSDADLIETNLQSTDCVGTDFVGANFTRANLSQAYLGDVNLSQACLHHANLKQTKFFGIEHLTVEQVNAANFWQEAIFDTKMTAKLNQK
ncbi:pentapeptide repeat-containing protein [Myxosarcina sp. GI1]|uniref:pentapeptide repeat-containing protein n=1 Tax=Myxosarcina sp. GI1 TaxID=1541065 RepID=UPI00055E055A|nr:pentapeptide repeat-containing protein [Myxosarcina sp. GI1]